MSDRDKVIEFIESCAETAPASLATALINWVGNTPDLIEVAYGYLGYGDSLCDDCGETRNACSCDDAEDEDDVNDDEPEYEAGRTCGMCGDELGDGERNCYIDEDGAEWSVHADCYRSGRYLDRAAYIASEQRMEALNKIETDAGYYAPYVELDLDGAKYYGDEASAPIQ